MAKLTPEEFADKHANRLSTSTEEIRRGVERVTEAPTKKAAAKRDKMKAGILKAIDSGKWERGLMRVSLDEWKEKMLTKAIARIPDGIAAARPKMIDFATQLNAFEDSLKATIDKMPDVTLEDSINRASAWMRGMAKFERK